MGEEGARPRDEDEQSPEELHEKDSQESPDEGSEDGDWVEDISDTVAPSIGPHS
jgi:hypothetical protein